MAVTRHQRMSLPSASVIDSVIVPFRVAGGSPGWQVAGVAAAQRETGDRMDGGGRDNFQVSGLGHQVPGAGIQVQVQVQDLCHLSISGGGWQPQVAGGGKSALCPLSSMQSSTQPSIQPSTQSSTQPSLCLSQPPTAIRYHLPRLLSSCPLFLRPSIFRKCPPSSLPSKSAP